MNKINRLAIEKPDGRIFYQYVYQNLDNKEPLKVEDFGITRPSSWTAPHQRYNHLRGEFVAISASRNARPFLPPAKYCPLCPMEIGMTDPDGNPIKSEIPSTNKPYDLAVFENIFPGLSKHDVGGGPTGHCEVIIFSREHEGHLTDFSQEHLEALVRVWQDRSREVGAMEHIEYVYLFENRGKEIGVTLHHPHGQLYAFNHTPPFVSIEHENAAKFYSENQKCLVCTRNEKELKDGSRIILETDSILAYVPEAARYPYEVHVTTKSHRPLIEQLNDQEIKQLATTLKRLVYKYDNLFGFDMPYVMAHHQAKAGDYDQKNYHWHIEFYPPYRTENKLKYLAGVESGTGFFINDTIPEETADQLRKIPCPF